MENKNSVVAWIAIVIAIGACLILAFKPINVTVEIPKQFGVAQDGDSNFTHLVASGDITAGDALTVEGESNLSGLISGGASLATTTNGAGAFTAAQVCDNNLIVATPNAQPVTLTFPSTAALIADCLPTIGDEKTIRLKNGTSTTGAASILTLADGANGDHQEQEGATTLVEGTEWAEITFMNIDGTNHLMLVSVTQVAD